MKDKLGGKIMNKFVELRAKTYDLPDNGSEDKKAKGTKACVIKKNLTLFRAGLFVAAHGSGEEGG